MHPLRTENLELTLDDNVVQLSVNGPITSETLQSSYDWIETAQSANDNLQLCIEMQADNFSDLAEASQQFRNVGTVLRRAHEIDRCAVITDSSWLRNSAKVEGAVIPGLNIMAFAPDESETAGKWLRDEPLIEDTPVETKTEEAPVAEEKAESDNPWDTFSVKDVDI